MSNETFETLAIAAVVAEALACVWTLRYKNLQAIALINLVGAGIIILLNAQNIGIAISTSDWGILLIVAFAFLTITTNLFWFARPKRLQWLVWVEFSVFSLLSIFTLILCLRSKLRVCFKG